MILLALASLESCKKYSGEKAAEQRNEWIESLKDSINQLESQRRADSIRLDELHTHLSNDIELFTQIANPREVEPYYILSAFKARYPLSSTGIAARMTNSEQIELIAALSGQKFNAIRISSGNQTATSQTVPADQALNYTSGGLTTVAFTGPQADSICMIVKDNQNSPVSLEYLQNGSVAEKINLSDDQKNWIEKTWTVCGSHKEAQLLEKTLLIDSRKIEILKITIDQEEAKLKNMNPQK